jgi:thiol-disulfide isomerase/thioredoxin
MKLRSGQRSNGLVSWATACFVAACLPALAVPRPAISANDSDNMSPRAQVQQGKADLAAGRVDKAIAVLSKAAKKLGTAPGSCDCHYNLGKAYCMKARQQKKAVPTEALSTFRSAKTELRTAIRVGKGNVISVQANDFLMSNLPPEIIAPRTGAGTEEIATKLGLATPQAPGQAAKAKVYEFYATWCDPCSQLKQVIAKVMKDHADELELKSFDVDDSASQEILDQYEVSPIPTIIYLTPDMRVVGYSIGFNDQKNVEKQLAKILKQS